MTERHMLRAVAAGRRRLEQQVEGRRFCIQAARRPRRLVSVATWSHVSKPDSDDSGGSSRRTPVTDPGRAGADLDGSAAP